MQIVCDCRILWAEKAAQAVKEASFVMSIPRAGLVGKIMYKNGLIEARSYWWS